MDIEKYVEKFVHSGAIGKEYAGIVLLIANGVYNQCLEDVKSKGQKYTNPSNPNDVKYFIHSDQFKNLKKP